MNQAEVFLILRRLWWQSQIFTCDLSKISLHILCIDNIIIAWQERLTHRFYLNLTLLSTHQKVDRLLVLSDLSSFIWYCSRCVHLIRRCLFVLFIGLHTLWSKDDSILRVTSWRINSFESYLSWFACLVGCWTAWRVRIFTINFMSDEVWFVKKFLWF